MVARLFIKGHSGCGWFEAVVVTIVLACVVAPRASAALPAGTLLTFGSNYYGELGSTTNNGVVAGNAGPFAVKLPSGAAVRRAAAGSDFSLLGTSGGQLYAFGHNQYGQLGVATNSGSDKANPAPLPVTLPAQAGTIAGIAAGGSHTLVLTSTGQLYSFGANDAGQLGITTNSGTFTPNNTPVLLPALAGQVGQISHVAAGNEFSLALTSAGQLYAWGSNTFGQLGNTTNNGNSHANATPTPVPISGQVTVIAAGGGHTLAATSAGQLYAFGENVAGELGNSTHTNSFDPTPTPTPVGLPGQSGRISQLAAGDIFSLALTSSGQLYAFGADDHGQLGFPPDGKVHPTPMRVSLPGQVGRITQIAASEESTFVVTSSGQLYAFGDNGFSELGSGGGGNISTPKRVASLVSSTIDDVGTGSESAHALVLVGNLTLLSTALPLGRVATRYAGGLRAVGGTPPRTWTITGLPAGLAPNPATGAITGTPTRAGTSAVTVTVTDAFGLQATRHLTLTIRPPSLKKMKIRPAAFKASNAATITYTDNARVTTRFAVLERRHGRLVTVERFTHNDRVGANKRRFSAHGLKPGRYLLRATPAGGKPITISFKIV